MQNSHRHNSFPHQKLKTRPLNGTVSDLSCHNREYKENDEQDNNIIKWNQVVMVNEHKEPDDDGDSSNKFSKLFWKRNRKRNSKKRIASNPSASVLVLSTRKQHKKQPLGITLRQEATTPGSKTPPGVYLIGIAPHSPFRTASRFVPHGSKILLVNGQPCPPSVKEVANRLLQVPQGAVLTLHFEVDNKNSTNKKTSPNKYSIFRKSITNSSSSMGLNPIDNNYDRRHNYAAVGASDYAFQQNLQHLRQQKLPPSILKKSPKYSQVATLARGCHAPSAMEMIVQTAVLPFQAAKLLHNEAVSELDELGKFFTQSWSNTNSSTQKSSRFACGTDASTALIEETNNRWASIRADELAEF